jgi:hypothetical protein
MLRAVDKPETIIVYTRDAWQCHELMQQIA